MKWYLGKALLQCWLTEWLTIFNEKQQLPPLLLGKTGQKKKENVACLDITSLHPAWLQLHLNQTQKPEACCSVCACARQRHTHTHESRLLHSAQWLRMAGKQRDNMRQWVTGTPHHHQTHHHPTPPPPPAVAAANPAPRLLMEGYSSAG